MRPRFPKARTAMAAMAAMPAAAVLLAAVLLSACAATKEPPAVEAPAKANSDKLLARLVYKGEFERSQRAADSLSQSKDPAEREIALYWKAVAWLYRDQPDSALTILEANQGKWTGGLRKVHAGLFLSLAREAIQSRASGRARHEEAAKPVSAPDRGMQERVEALQQEAGELRAENARLATEKEKYQKLLKDLETIR